MCECACECVCMLAKPLTRPTVRCSLLVSIRSSAYELVLDHVMGWRHCLQSQPHPPPGVRNTLSASCNSGAVPKFASEREWADDNREHRMDRGTKRKTKWLSSLAGKPPAQKASGPDNGNRFVEFPDAPLITTRTRTPDVYVCMYVCVLCT